MQHHQYSILPYTAPRLKAQNAHTSCAAWKVWVVLYLAQLSNLVASQTQPSFATVLQGEAGKEEEGNKGTISANAAGNEQLVRKAAFRGCSGLGCAAGITLSEGCFRCSQILHQLCVDRQRCISSNVVLVCILFAAQRRVP